MPLSYCIGHSSHLHPAEGVGSSICLHYHLPYVPCLLDKALGLRRYGSSSTIQGSMNAAKLIIEPMPSPELQHIQPQELQILQHS